MKLFFTLLLFNFSGAAIHAQSIAGNFYDNNSKSKKVASHVNFNGQWRGSFNEASSPSSSLLGNYNTTYVLEINVSGKTISGYSYTYFTDLGPKRYYTICRITGTVNNETNSIVVTEVERIKYNTPPNIQNCFQIHRLHFEKGDDNTEYLKGDWVPAPNQTCGGSGETVLSRQVLSKTPFAIKLPPKREETARSEKTEHTRKHQPATVMGTPKPKMPVKKQPLVKSEPKKSETKIATSEIPLENNADIATTEKKILLEYPPAPVYRGYEKRKSEVVKSIKIKNQVFHVDFYDNGEIDGDTISVFFNGKLIASHKMLTAQPLTLTLSIDKNFKNNVITMYAENLGSIPPNTAVMIVRDGDKRYEARMESDMKRSGSVIFTHEDD